jgi:hypothetical protein
VVSNGLNAPALSDGRVCNIARKITGTGELKVIGETPTPMPLSTINPALIAPAMEVSNYPTTAHELLKSKHSVYLVNEEGVETGGLKVHVDDDNVGRLNGGIVVSTAELTVGDVLLPLALNISVSLIVTSDKGERTTDPGVMLGSSSTLLI